MDTKVRAKIEGKCGKAPAVKKVDTAASGKKAAAASASPAVKAEAVKTVIPAPDAEILRTVIYRESAQVLSRNAEPNERFGIGDAMPVYYL